MYPSLQEQITIAADESAILIVGLDVERSERIGGEVAHCGYRVFITESAHEIGAAIWRVLPHLIMLDYSWEAHRAGINPAGILRYLGNDIPMSAPPVLVIAPPEMQDLIPVHPDIFPIYLPVSLEILPTLVQDHLGW